MLFLTMLILFTLILIQAVFEARLKDMAMAVPLMCCAADILSVPSRKQIVIVGDKQSLELEEMLAAAHALFEPNKTVSDRVLTCRLYTSIIFLHLAKFIFYLLFYIKYQVIHVDPTNLEEMQFWEENNSNVALMAKNNFAPDKVVALVCQNFTCSPPANDPKSLVALLSRQSPSSS